MSISPTSSKSLSFDETPSSEPVLPVVEQVDADTLNIWEHFHTIPDGADQRRLSLFFYEREIIEVGLLPEQPLKQPESFTSPAPSPGKSYSPLDALKARAFLNFHKPKTSRSSPNGKPFRCPIPECPSTGFYEKQGVIEHLKDRHYLSPESLDEWKEKLSLRIGKKALQDYPCPISTCYSGFSGKWGKYELTKHLKKRHQWPSQTVKEYFKKIEEKKNPYSD